MSDTTNFNELKSLLEWVNQSGDIEELSIKYGDIELALSKTPGGLNHLKAAPAPAAPAPTPEPGPATGPDEAAPATGEHVPALAKAVEPANLGLAVPPLDAAKADMAQVLDPFEIADRHPARVGVKVGDDDHATVAQDLVGLGGDGAVRGLDHQLGLDAGGVVGVDHAFDGGRWRRG
mgnify:CR=1 FL=1